MEATQNDDENVFDYQKGGEDVSIGNPENLTKVPDFYYIGDHSSKVDL